MIKKENYYSKKKMETLIVHKTIEFLFEFLLMIRDALCLYSKCMRVLVCVCKCLYKNYFIMIINTISPQNVITHTLNGDANY